MKKLPLGGAAAAAILAAGGALAQPAPPAPAGVAQGTTPLPGTPQKRMVVMSNKTISRGDVVAHVRRLFSRLDANKDGFLSRDEVRTMHERVTMQGGPMGAHHMRPRDRAAAFDRLDTNKDGSISRQEFMTAQPRIEERRVIVMKGAHDGRAGMRMRGMGMRFGGNMFDMADANKDGRVSLAEAQQLALARFDRADINHDGKVTPEERRQAHQRVHSERHPG